MSELTIMQGDVSEKLRELGDNSVQCVVTSPPYWGLRDYGVDGQIGLERTVGEWVEKIVAVFGAVRRVLRDDGTCWLNIGDAYCAGTGVNRLPTTTPGRRVPASWSNRSQPQRIRPSEGIKAKDLVGMPWRAALALQADGWYLRSDIIWSKPNPMPESVSDRPTKSHEYLFLLSKSERYYYNADAIKEKVTGNAHARYKTPDGWDTSIGSGGHGSYHRNGREEGNGGVLGTTPVGYEHTRLGKEGRNSRIHVNRDPRHAIDQIHRRAPGVNPKATPAGSGIKQNESFSAAVCDLVDLRNKRSVWEIATQAYPDAHFATFPEDLVKPCVLAGSRPGDVVLDPFGGSGTVGKVAIELGRRAVLIELKGEYCQMARRRCATTIGMSL